MFCVKEPRDIPRAISTVIENGAQDRTMLEIKVGDLLALNLTAAPGWDQVRCAGNIQAGTLGGLLCASFISFCRWDGALRVFCGCSKVQLSFSSLL
jgi:hypothetical protein